MKPRGSVWRYYDKIVDRENNTAYRCRYCNKIYKNKHATRLREHLKKCSNVPTTVKNLLKNTTQKDTKSYRTEEESSGEDLDSGNYARILYLLQLFSFIALSRLWFDIFRYIRN